MKHTEELVARIDYVLNKYKPEELAVVSCYRLLKECQEFLLSPNPTQGWQDISTAPREEKYYGDEIILTNDIEVFFGHWFKGKWYRRDCADLMECSPTKWQPLPTLPDVNEKGDG